MSSPSPALTLRLLPLPSLSQVIVSPARWQATPFCEPSAILDAPGSVSVIESPSRVTVSWLASPPSAL